jgi:hypothetical protein
MIVRMAVPLDRRSEIQQLIDSRITDRPAVAIKSQFHDLAALPLNEALKDRHFPIVIGRFFLIVALIVCWMWLFGSGPTGVREFDTSFIFGLAIPGWARLIPWRRSGNSAGTPLVRLSIRQNWLKAICFGPVAFGLYSVGRKYGVTNEWIGYGSGIAFGWAVGEVISAVIRKRLDIRENGLLVEGHFVPWADVRLLSWDPARSGRLILRKGRRRFPAHVPSEQRDAVTAILKEKLSCLVPNDGQ